VRGREIGCDPGSNPGGAIYCRVKRDNIYLSMMRTSVRRASSREIIAKPKLKNTSELESIPGDIYIYFNGNGSSLRSQLTKVKSYRFVFNFGEETWLIRFRSKINMRTE